MDASIFDYYHDKALSHPLFRRLTLSEKESLKEFYFIQEYLKGEHVIFDGDILESLYLVIEGSVRHYNDKKPVHAYFAGDFWGMDTLSHPRREQGKYTVREDSIILRLRGEGFRRFQQLNPGIRYGLKTRKDNAGHLISGFPENQLKCIRVKAGRGIIEFEGRTSKKSLSLFMIFPAVAILAGLIMIQRSNWSLLFILTGLVMTGCELFLRSMTYYHVSDKTAYKRFFNWRNFRRDQEEIPLDQVKSVSVNIRGPVRKLLKIGDLTIQTAGRGLLFRNIDNPEDLQNKLMDMKMRKQQEDQSESREEFRNMVRSNFQDHNLIQYKGDKSSRQSPVCSDKKIFRKSAAVLIFQLFVPLSLLSLSFLPDLFIADDLHGGVSLVLWLLRLIIALRVLWIILDWWNDIYKIDLPFIWDIERKPFGSEDVRTQTDLSGVLNVKVSQKGLFRILLNYGDVIIETPGDSGTLQFFSVRNPLKVQSEIFLYRDQLIRNKEKKQNDTVMEQFGEFSEILQQVQTVSDRENHSWERRN